MGKISSISSNSSGGNGGVMGSGVYGMVGSTVLCKAEDNSFFCTLTKTVSGIFMFLFLIIFLLAIVYFVMNFSYYYKMFFQKKQ